MVYRWQRNRTDKNVVLFLRDVLGWEIHYVSQFNPLLLYLKYDLAITSELLAIKEVLIGPRQYLVNQKLFIFKQKVYIDQIWLNNLFGETKK